MPQPQTTLHQKRKLIITSELTLEQLQAKYASYAKAYPILNSSHSSFWHPGHSQVMYTLMLEILTYED